MVGILVERLRKPMKSVRMAQRFPKVESLPPSFLFGGRVENGLIVIHVK
jgi:hypothetical protein